MHCHSSSIIQMLKPMHITTKTRQKGLKIIINQLKPMRIAATIAQKEHRKHTWILAPGRPSDKDNVLHAPAQLRLARTHGTHGTHETKTKTKRKPISRLRGADKPD